MENDRRTSYLIFDFAHENMKPTGFKRIIYRKTRQRTHEE